MSRRRDPKSHLTDFVRRLRDQGRQETFQASTGRGRPRTGEGGGRYALTFSGRSLLATAPTRGRSFPPRLRKDTDDDNLPLTVANVALSSKDEAWDEEWEHQRRHRDKGIRTTQESSQGRPSRSTESESHDVVLSESRASILPSTSTGSRALGSTDSVSELAAKRVDAKRGMGKRRSGDSDKRLKRPRTGGS
ncbi:metacyclin III [Trypanosoma cruzi marinkellei]|uniref:Metacyclin III n=1 Tax=Trypanosoma cruzi marinkellei TaxID=85056 RepID=K2NV19_TRYCR|nr:metacyclin III [Trypanosoma cruzi marinkellei]